jgi:Zn finger protein HypA/HybF involved in hydrogenase expression
MSQGYAFKATFRCSSCDETSTYRSDVKRNTVEADECPNCNAKNVLFELVDGSMEEVL